MKMPALNPDLPVSWDPERHERVVNRAVGAPVLPTQHTRSYYVVRTLARAVTLLSIAAAFVALTSEWSIR